MTMEHHAKKQMMKVIDYIKTQNKHEQDQF